MRWPGRVWHIQCECDAKQAKIIYMQILWENFRIFFIYFLLLKFYSNNLGGYYILMTFDWLLKSILMTNYLCFGNTYSNASVKIWIFISTLPIYATHKHTHTSLMNFNKVVCILDFIERERGLLDGRMIIFFDYNWLVILYYLNISCVFYIPPLKTFTSLLLGICLLGAFLYLKLELSCFI